MVSNVEPVEVHVGHQGRLVIPASLRKSLGIGEGDTLIARSDQGRLVLEKPEAILARVRQRFRRVPTEISLVDELIEERRVEARREDVT
jgi:AbrB family looped-hinge helix DNA binding protein